MNPSRHGRAVRIFITLLGAAFILQVAGSTVLGVVGERGTAVITHVRRELGERNEIIPNRYTYIVSYTFTTPDGHAVIDSTRYIGNAIYVKASGKHQVPVRYLKSFPVFNTLERDTKFSWGKLVLLITGVFLIMVMNRPARKTKDRQVEFRNKNTKTLQRNSHQTSEVKGGSVGFSDRINDPAFARYLKDTTRWAFLFASILAVVAVGGFYIYGEYSGEMDNPEALYIGLGIGGMFMVIAALQTIGRKRSKTWDGVVVDKQIRRKPPKRGESNSDYTIYSVIICNDDGDRITIDVEEDDTIYRYYQIGDRVRHHKGLNSFEKYDKSEDAIIFCNACASLNDIRDDRCFRCKCPLLK